MQNDRLSVVLLHDWLTGFRGGERVLESFCEIFPDAPIYTLIHKAGSTSDLIESKKITVSFLSSWPGVEKHYRKFLPFFPKAAESLKIKEKPVVVLSSSHCVIKGVRKPEGSVHVSYVHSPMRYMYDQFDQYFGPSASLPIQLGGRAFRPYLTSWDISSNKNVDVLVANSKFVRERIRKFYNRDAEVIYPFVDLQDFEVLKSNPVAKQDYFVMVTAFAPNKRVDLAVEAFNRLKIPLVIIGGGQMDKELRAMAGPTIKFLGNVDRRTVIETLAGAQALIFPGVEDFGITPLESLAAGTPVIAFREGGVLETLTEKDTVFFNQPTADALCDAVRALIREGRSIDQSRLPFYSRKRFQGDIQNIIERALNGYRI